MQDRKGKINISSGQELFIVRLFCTQEKTLGKRHH